MITKLKLTTGLFLLLGFSAFGTTRVLAQNAEQAGPGTLNYVEGAVSIDGRQVTPQAVGSAGLGPEQVLATGHGKAEMLLTPGVFFRLDDNSSAKLVSPDLTKTVVELESGRAAVEVDQIFKQNNIQVVENGNPTQLLKPGLYEFDANLGTVRVFDGEAVVQDHQNKSVKVKGHHELALRDATNLKAHGFEVDAAKDELYNWSSLRSQYLAQANEQIAGNYGYAGFVPGWYWDPYAYGYTFVGIDPFWSPFGWGFYGRGFYGRGFYGPGYYGRGFYGHPGDRGGVVSRGGFQGGGGFHGGGGSHGGGRR